MDIPNKGIYENKYVLQILMPFSFTTGSKIALIAVALVVIVGTAVAVSVSPHCVQIG